MVAPYINLGQVKENIRRDIEELTTPEIEGAVENAKKKERKYLLKLSLSVLIAGASLPTIPLTAGNEQLADYSLGLWAGLFSVGSLGSAYYLLRYIGVSYVQGVGKDLLEERRNKDYY